MQFCNPEYVDSTEPDSEEASKEDGLDISMVHEAADEASHLLIATPPALEDIAEESIHPLTVTSDADSTSMRCQGDDAKKYFEMTIEDGSQKHSKKNI